MYPERDGMETVGLGASEALLISSAFDLYKTDVIAFRNQSRKTEEHHDTALKSLLRFLKTDKDVLSLTFEDVRDWKISMEKRKLNPVTIRGYLIKLRVVLNYLRLRGYDVLDPVMIPLPKRLASIPGVLSPGEVKLLIEACEVPRSKRINRLRNKAVISLLYSTGLRVSELCALNIRDVEKDSFPIVGKGGVSRICFVDSRSRTMLGLYLSARTDNNPALFVSNGERISVGTVQEIFKFARKKAGFDWPVHPHTMRHSFATNLMTNGIDLYQLMKMMGHSSLNTTQMYLKIHDKHLKADFEKYHTI